MENVFFLLMPMEEFFTKDRANEGIKFPLTRPDGTKTDHWLLVRGVDSDVCQRINRENRREFAFIEATAKAIECKDTRAKYLADEYERLENKAVAALIADWSFETECNPEEVQAFLREAPQIFDAVNRVAGNRAVFFRNGPDNLKPSQG
jgi:hypothetical protein